jgi:hypothetical protein
MRESSRVTSQSLQQRADPTTITYSTMAYSGITNTLADHGTNGCRLGTIATLSRPTSILLAIALPAPTQINAALSDRTLSCG